MIKRVTIKSLLNTSANNTTLSCYFMWVPWELPLTDAINVYYYYDCLEKVVHFIPKY